MRWSAGTDAEPLQLRTSAGGVITLFRPAEIAAWLEDVSTKPAARRAVWRGFTISDYKRQTEITWTPCP